jgi:hypothetical protein
LWAQVFVVSVDKRRWQGTDEQLNVYPQWKAMIQQKYQRKGWKAALIRLRVP